MTTRGMRYGIPGDFGKLPLSTMVCDYGCPPPDAPPCPPDPLWPWPWLPRYDSGPVIERMSPPVAPVPCPPPSPVGGMVETVRQRLVEARQSRSTLDAEIETLEKMLRAAGVET